jgi:phosphoribosylaminoimidazole-succinocarboxamide synthase
MKTVKKVLDYDFLKDLEVRSGKVRLVSRVPGSCHREFPNSLAVLATNRTSAGDVVFDEIEGKGILLNQTNNAWKRILSQFIKTDFVTDDEKRILRIFNCDEMSSEIRGRLTIVNEAIPIPLELIGRITIDGSLWKMYSESGCREGLYLGNNLPRGLTKGQRLQESLFTPSTKEGTGKHDRNIDYEEMVTICDDFLEKNGINEYDGPEIAEKIRTTTEVICWAAECLLKRHGQNLGDTKLEFGMVRCAPNHMERHTYELCLIDEALTGDSSRILMDGVHYDKQYLRDYLKEAGWDGKSRFQLPKEVKKVFIQRYGVNMEIAKKIAIPFLTLF